MASSILIQVVTTYRESSPPKNTYLLALWGLEFVDFFVAFVELKETLYIVLYMLYIQGDLIIFWDSQPSDCHSF